MAILFTSQSTSGDTVTVNVVSDLAAPTFYWYFDGAYAASSATGSRAFTLSPGEQARIAVLDSEDPDFDPIADGPEGYPARVTLEWIRSLSEDTGWYRIEQSKNGGAAEIIAKVKHVAGQWSYRYVTPRLTDLASYVWTITPLDRVGNLSASPVANATRLIVRWPDAPNFDAEYESGPDQIHVEAA